MWCLCAERELRFSPVWDGEGLVYDARLGDVFVVPALGREVLCALQAQGPMDTEELALLGQGNPDGDAAASAASLQELLGSFEANRLIERFNAGCCGPGPG